MEQLRFVGGVRTHVVDEPPFGLALTDTGDPELWAPYRTKTGSLVAVAGRPTFEDMEWSAARAVDGSGGLAAKIIYGEYQKHGAAALERLNGNYVVIVHDRVHGFIHLATDCCGVFPVFQVETRDGWLYCSHPDVLAGAADEGHRLDETSLAEFILTGTVTPPFSYYERVRAADHGTVLTWDANGGRPVEAAKRRFFEFAYRGESSVREEDLACQLAAAVRRAVQRRTLPRLGPYAVALSGGLDSRAVLASGLDRERALAFTCYDEPNREFRTAEAIARLLSVRFLPLRRGPDYYAEHAALGVRISGGMGTFANNHFLGVIPRLRSEGVENLLTGCYCDYLFKALPLNRRSHWLTRRKELAPFRHEFYFDHFPASTGLAQQARERWESRIPVELQNRHDTASLFQIEARRTFPVCYEGDNQQRLVPQRVAGWCPPFVDRDVIDVYCRIPYRYKLNRSLFRKAVVALAPELGAIPDANTGASLRASPAWEWVRESQLRLQRKWRILCRPATSEESWPNWPHYVRHSRTLDALWKRPNPDAMDLFRRVLGPAGMPDDVEELKRHHPFLFVGLLSLKLWFDQRES